MAVRGHISLLVYLVGASCVLVILSIAAPAAAQSTWSGTGTFSFTSTPSPGTCDGNGQAQISLDGDGGSDTGSLSLYFSYVSPDCNGDLPGEGTGFAADVSFAQSGNSVSGTDEYGDPVSGGYSGDTLSLTLTVASSSSGGGQCVEYCNTVYTFTLTGSGSLFAAGFGSTSDLAAAAGGIAGAAGLAGAAASGRGPRRTPPDMSASYPAPTLTGYLPNSPTGVGGVTLNAPMMIGPPLLNAPVPAFPPWGYDYRTTPYTPNPLIQGWPEFVQRFQNPPDPPGWPPNATPRPPTNFPGVFCEQRVNPETGRWRWWNPVNGTFPWGG